MPILNYSDVLSELMINKSYAVYILEKYISLLQFTKCIMLKSLITYVSKAFKLVLRIYIIFQTLNFVHMNCSDSFHPTSDVVGDLSNFILVLSDTEQIWLSTYVEKYALSSMLKFQNGTFYGLVLFITSIWKCSMYYFFKKMLIFALLQLNLFFRKKIFWKRFLNVKY